MLNSELLVALGNISVDKVATVPTFRNRKIDKRAPLKIGRVQAACEGTGKRKMEFWEGSEFE